MGDKGPEQPTQTPENTLSGLSRAAIALHPHSKGIPGPFEDAALTQVIASWPNLSAAARERILSIADDISSQADASCAPPTSQ